MKNRFSFAPQTSDLICPFRKKKERGKKIRGTVHDSVRSESFLTFHTFLNVFLFLISFSRELGYIVQEPIGDSMCTNLHWTSTYCSRNFCIDLTSGSTFRVYHGPTVCKTRSDLSWCFQDSRFGCDLGVECLPFHFEYKIRIGPTD